MNTTETTVIEAGYAELARILTERFRLEKPMDSRQVHMWFRRGTKNKDGIAFPGPYRVDRNAPRTTPRYLFDADVVTAWYAAGVPAKYGHGWTVPAGN